MGPLGCTAQPSLLVRIVNFERMRQSIDQAGDEHEHDGGGGFLVGGCLGTRFGIDGLPVAARRLEPDQED